MATVKAIYEDGFFKPTEPVHLAEHTEVEVSVPSPALAQGVVDDPTGWMAMRELIGLAGAADHSDGTASEDHDAIVYRR